MADALNDRIENAEAEILNQQTQKDAPAVNSGATGKEKAIKAAEHIGKADRNLAVATDNDIEKLLEENERKREERIENARRQMTQETERARKNAEAGDVKTGGEYRRAFSGKDRLKEQILEQQRAFAESEDEEARKQRIEQLLKREDVTLLQGDSYQNQAEKTEAQADMECVEDECAEAPNQSELGVWHSAEELLKTEDVWHSAEEIIGKDVLDFGMEKRAAEDGVWHSASDLVADLDSPENETEEQREELPEPSEETDSDRIILKIDAYKILGQESPDGDVGGDACFGRYAQGEPSNCSCDANFGTIRAQRQIASEAIDAAADIHEEELRRLIEEEKLYNGEIQAIRAKRMELERRRAGLPPYPISDEYQPVEYGIPSRDEHQPIGYSFPTPENPMPYMSYGDGGTRADIEKYADLEKQREAIDDYERDLEAALQGKDFPENPDTYGTDYGFSGYGIGEPSSRAVPRQEPLSEPAEQTRNSPEGSETSYLDRRELIKFLSKNSKQEFTLIKKAKKAERRQKRTPGIIGVNLAVERIQTYKELIKIASENLVICVGANDKKEAARRKKKLHAYILQFNIAAEEYEILTGESAPYIESSVADDVAMGKPCPMIPDIQYVDIEKIESDFMSEDDKRAARIEKLRFAKEHGKEMRRIAKRAKKGLPPVDSNNSGYTRRDNAKQYAERMNAVKLAKQRDELLVKARMEYEIVKLENEMNMSLYSFSVKDERKKNEARRITGKIKRLRRNIKKALMLEKEDNKRYYYLKLVEPEFERVKKRTNPERLASLRMRLDVLLSERESLNERLLSLYGRNKKHTEKRGFDAKNNEVVKKYAKLVYKSQKRLAAKVEKLHAPVDLKEKIYTLMNQKTECAVEIETSKYKLKVADIRGSAKAELIRKIRSAKSRIRGINRDVDFLIRKARKQDDDYADNRAMGAWIIGVLLFVVAALLLWHMFSDKISPFLTKLLEWFNG